MTCTRRWEIIPRRITHTGSEPATLSSDLLPCPQALSRLDSICQTLAEQGYVIVPDFLDRQTCRALAEESRHAWQQGEFRPAGVGRGEALQVRPDIRSDQIRWLALLEAYRQQLNRQLFLGLVEFEGHCALYPPGSFYQRHLDQFRGVEQHTVTAILYLNEDWQAEDGGQLRIYLDEEQGTVLDVLPEQGTLVTFLSANYWHEVLPAQRDRLSLTGWFKTRPVGDIFPLA